jgi:transcriptional regulator with XRE-family HTH domain
MVYKNKILTRRIREERQKKGWTQKHMAELIGVQAATFSGYERGYRIPETKTVEKLGDLYGVSVDYLLGRDETWLDKDSPPDDIELEQFIREHSNLRVFGDPLSEDVKDDVMLALKAAWEVVKRERAVKKPEGQ